MIRTMTEQPAGQEENPSSSSQVYCRGNNDGVNSVNGEVLAEARSIKKHMPQSDISV
jgi:hypothetical protein